MKCVEFFVLKLLLDSSKIFSKSDINDRKAIRYRTKGFPGGSGESTPPMQETQRGRFSSWVEKKGSQLQYSGLGNAMDRGAWWV